MNSVRGLSCNLENAKAMAEWDYCLVPQKGKGGGVEAENPIIRQDVLLVQ